MTDANARPPRPLPLFYSRIAVLTAARHGDLRLVQPANYRFAAATNAIPLSLAEFATAAQHYPIVFTAGDHPMPVALVGYRTAQNVFVDEAGEWARNAYVPAYARTYPFILIEPDGGSDLMLLGVETDAACLSKTDGAALFQDGKPTAGLNDALAFCKAYRDDIAATRRFADALKTAGVLEERSATVSSAAGGLARLDGFLQLSPEGLAALDDAIWLAWRRQGWIDAIYAHIHSAGRWAQLIDATNAAAVVDRDGR